VQFTPSAVGMLETTIMRLGTGATAGSAPNCTNRPADRGIRREVQRGLGLVQWGGVGGTARGSKQFVWDKNGDFGVQTSGGGGAIFIGGGSLDIVGSETNATSISSFKGPAVGLGGSGGGAVVLGLEKTISLGREPYEGRSGSIGGGMVRV